MDRQPPIGNSFLPPNSESQHGAPAPNPDHQQYLYMQQPVVVYPQIAYDASGQPQIIYMMPQQLQQPLHQHYVQTLQQPLQQPFQQTIQQQQFLQQPFQQSFQQPLQQTLQQPLQQTLQQPLQQTLQQPLQQTLQQPFQQTLQQPFQQTLQQRLQQPFQQTLQQPLQQSLQRPLQQTLQQPLQQPLQQLLQKPVQQQFQQSIQQPLQQPIQQPLQQTFQQSLQQQFIPQPIQKSLQQPTQKPLQQRLQQPLQQLIVTSQRIGTQPQHTQQINPQQIHQQTSQPSQQTYRLQNIQLQLPMQQQNLKPVVISQHSAKNTRTFTPIAPLQNAVSQTPRLQPIKSKYDCDRNLVNNSPTQNVNISINVIKNKVTSTVTSMSHSLSKSDKHVPMSTISQTVEKSFIDTTIASGNMPWKRNQILVPNTTQSVPICSDMSVVNIKDGVNYEIQNKKQKTNPSINAAETSVCENKPNVAFDQQWSYGQIHVANETFMNEPSRKCFPKLEQMPTTSSKALNALHNYGNIVQNINETASINKTEQPIKIEKSSIKNFDEESNTRKMDLPLKVLNVGNEPKESLKTADNVPKPIVPTIGNIGNQNVNTPDKKPKINELSLAPLQKRDTVQNKTCDIFVSKTPLVPLDIPPPKFIDSKDTKKKTSPKHKHCNDLNTTMQNLKQKIQDNLNVTPTLDGNTDPVLNIMSPYKAKMQKSNKNELELQAYTTNKLDTKIDLQENMNITSNNKLITNFVSNDNEVTSSSSPSKISTSYVTSRIPEASGTNVNNTNDEKNIPNTIQRVEMHCTAMNKSKENDDQNKPNLHETSSLHVVLSRCDEVCNDSTMKSKSKSRVRKNLKTVMKPVTSSQITNNEEKNKQDIQSILKLALHKFKSLLDGNCDNLESVIWNEIMLTVDKNPTVKMNPNYIDELRKSLKDYLNSIKTNAETRTTVDKTDGSQANISTATRENDIILKERLARIVNTYKDIVSNDPKYKITEGNKEPILTHVVEGYVIQESNKPFSVMKYNQPRTSPETRVTRSKENLRPQPENRSSKVVNPAQGGHDPMTLPLDPPLSQTDDVNPFSGISQTTIHSWKVWDLALHLVKHGWYNTAVTLMDHEMDGSCLSFCSREQLLEIGIEKERVDIIMSNVDRTFGDTSSLVLDTT